MSDFIEALLTEIEEARTDLAGWIATICSVTPEDPAFGDALDQYVGQIDRTASTCGMLGLRGLESCCAQVQECLVVIFGLNAEERSSAQTFFDLWPDLVLAYLADITNFESAEHLAEHFSQPPCPAPVDADGNLELIIALTAEPVLAEYLRAEAAAEELERPRVATDEDLSLALPTDVDRGVYEALLHEAPTQAAELSTYIRNIVDGEATNEDMAAAKRIAHSLKGSASIVGIRGIATLGHHTEDILEWFEQNQKRPPLALTNALLDATACLEQMIGSLLGIEDAPTQTQSKEILQSVLDWASWIHSGNIEDEIDATSPVLADLDASLPAPTEITDLEATFAIQTETNDFNTTPPIQADNADLVASLLAPTEITDLEATFAIQTETNDLNTTPLIQADNAYLDASLLAPTEITDLEATFSIQTETTNLNTTLPLLIEAVHHNKTHQALTETFREEKTSLPEAPLPNNVTDQIPVAPILRVPVATMDELFRLTGELSVKIGQLTEQVKQTQQRTNGLLRQNLKVQQRIFDLENLVDIRGLSSLRETKISRSDQIFDALEMEQYTELQSNTRALTEEAADTREFSRRIEEDVAQMGAVLQQTQRVQRELQYMAMTTRMSPVGSLAPRLHRNIRQTSQQTGKKAKLIIEGEDILIDGDMLNNLVDPLLHILRNAIDHGIETPDERTRAGKSEVSTIHLTFSRRGQTVTVRCRDDGHGLDYSAIRNKAIERGLMQAGQDVSEEELSRLILLPGFSTRERANEISGRGVGLDVVRDRLLVMKGMVEVRSEFGKGCEFLLRFQASLVAQHALLIESSTQIFAVPSYALDQALPPAAGEFISIGSEINLRYQKRTYPVKTLSALIGYDSGVMTSEIMNSKSVLLVHVDLDIHAVLVDRIVDGRDLILKDPGRYVKKINGVGGIAILGDGTVAPLLDLAELLRLPMPQLIEAATSINSSNSEAITRRDILVVDDSLSVRKSLVQLVSDAGYNVKAAKDGLEAIALLKDFMPGIILTDLEMPNMNGLELTSHLRARADTRELPVIMITSRSMDKHRKQAELAGVSVYMTKPYTDTDLLGHIHGTIGRVQ
ncbi:hybrid sensor histidine kinase/response regulator [Candidatus Nitrotoga sp. BS]|uniref:hybrid sensor histidine kinase/response regulator n=1 Tax=Candidatus Nitrotoga sp. BS TaxID=2890408 RepID=UPI001EF200BD|nr:response regulator [Candidatus Nitrotoga sp. BS]